MGPPQHSNGVEHAEQATLGHRGLINRTEYVRLLEQALRALGYEAVAHALEHASGIAQQPSSAAAFRAAVMSGDWSAALALLPSVAADPASVAASRFLILKRKFVEGLARGETADALQVLRTELQPLSASQSVLHSLAALLLRSPPSSPSSPAGLASLGTPSSSTGGGGRGSPSGGNIATGGAGVSEEQLLEGRAALLDELQDSLVPSLLIPERRLEELVEQALVAQLDRNPYHNTLVAHLSLLNDYTAGPEQLPTQPAQLLDDHSSEVWAIAFSPDGRWAASASKDGTALLWTVTGAGRLEAPRLLLRQIMPCQLVAFSPSSNLVLVASLDTLVRLYDVASLKLLRQYSVMDEGQASGGSEQVVAVSWLPDGASFLAATHRSLLLFDARQGGGAAPLRRLQSPHAFLYDAAALGGSCVVTVGSDKKIGFVRLSDGRTELVGEAGTVTSLGVSRCGFLVTNLNDSTVHLWRLPDGLALTGGGGVGGGTCEAADGVAAGGGSMAADVELHWASRSPGEVVGGGSDPLDALPQAPLHEFHMAGGRPSRYVLRSCVGGARAGFVACGAEDARLYIWSRLNGQLLDCLEGHTGTINAVAWHPVLPWLLASASDDGTIRTWVAPAAAARQ